MAELSEDRPAQAAFATSIDATGAPIIAVSGELDMSNAGALQAIVASVAAERPERVIFDLSGVRFIDSAGIAVLLVCGERVPEVHLRKPSQAVRRVIELTGLTDALILGE